MNVFRIKYNRLMIIIAIVAIILYLPPSQSPNITINQSAGNIKIQNSASVTMPSMHWNFEEGTGSIVEDIVGGHNGTIFGANWEGSGILGNNSLDFEESSDDHILVSDHDDLSFGNGLEDRPFSLSAWIYREADTDYGNIICKYDNVNKYREWIFYINGPSKGLIFTLHDESTDGYISASAYTGGTQLVAKTLYHVAATYDGSGSENGLAVWVNGTDDTVTRESANYIAMENMGEPVRIGKQGEQTTRSFDGIMDDVRIYDIELSKNDIEDIMNEDPSYEYLINGDFEADNVGILNPWSNVTGWEGIDNGGTAEIVAGKALKMTNADSTNDYGTFRQSFNFTYDEDNDYTFSGKFRLELDGTDYSQGVYVDIKFLNTSDDLLGRIVVYMSEDYQSYTDNPIYPGKERFFNLSPFGANDPLWSSNPDTGWIQFQYDVGPILNTIPSLDSISERSEIAQGSFVLSEYTSYIEATSTYFDNMSFREEISAIQSPTPPTVTITSPTSTLYGTDSINISLTGDATNYWYYIEGVDVINQSWSTDVLRTLADGNYTLHAYGSNLAGYETSVSISFTVDTTAPIVTIMSPTSTTYGVSTVTVSLAGDAINYWYYIEGVEVTNQSWSTDVLRTLADGSYTLHAYGSDLVGNEASVSVSFTVDTTAPTVTIISPTSTTYGIDTVTVSLVGDAINYWYYIEGVDADNQTWTTDVFRTLADGSYTLHAYGEDLVGNEAHVFVSFTIDTTAPTVMISNPMAITYGTNAITISLTGDAINYWYYIEGVDVTNQSWTTDVPRTLANGSYILHAYGNDLVGNEAHVSVSFTIDTTPPMVVIISPTNTAYGVDSITVSLTGDAVSYWYYIEGVDGSNQSWTTNVDRTLTTGSYILHAYGDDLVGNEAHVFVSFTIDTTAPTVTISSPMGVTYSTETITVSLTGDAVSYWYYIEGEDGSNQSWTTDVNRTLTTGSYILHAYGDDLVGNEAHVSVSFTIDTIAPTVTISNPIGGTYGTDTIIVSLTGDAINYWYYIEGADVTNLTWTTDTLRTLTDSSYILHAYGNDSSGNEAHVATVFTIDTTPPTVTILSPASTTYNINSNTISFAGNAVLYWYYIDGVDVNNQSWTMGVSRTLADGTYTLYAYGADNVGNIAYVSVTFTIDTTAPVLVISNPVSTIYNVGAITVSLSGDASSYWYYIGGIDVNNQTWTIDTIRSLADGTYTLHAYGADNVGNEAYVIVTFTIDTTAPVLVISSPVSTTYNVGNITISLSGDATSYWYYIAGVDANNQSWTNEMSRLFVDGTYTLHAYGEDHVGNIAYLSVTFTIDTTAPSLVISSPFSTTYNIDTITVSLTGDATNYWYYIEGIDVINQTWISDVTRSLADGTYSLHAYGADNIGNEVHFTVTFSIDTTAPTLMILSPTSTTYDFNTITISLTGDATNYWYYIGGVDVNNQTWTMDTTRLLPDGTYTLHAYGADNIGNEVYITIMFTIDTTAPTVIISSPISTIYTTETVTVSLIGDATSYFYYIVGIDVINQSWTSDVTRTLADGTYTLHAYGVDNAGNIGHGVITFTIEKSTTTTDASSDSTTIVTTTESSPTNTTSPKLSSFPGISLIGFAIVLFVIIKKKK